MKKNLALLTLSFTLLLKVDTVFGRHNDGYKISRTKRLTHRGGWYQASNMYRDVFWREIDLDNLCRNYEIERSEYEYTYLDEDNKDEKNPLTKINDGLKIVIGSIKRFLRNLMQSVKHFLVFTFGGCFDGRSLFSSGCWILPTTIVASGLLARDEICPLVDNNFVGCTITNETATTTEEPCVPTVTSNPTPLTCTCLNFMTGAGDGNCLTTSPDPSHCDMLFCYVAPGNTCVDLVESTTIPGLFYSTQACL